MLQYLVDAFRLQSENNLVILLLYWKTERYPQSALESLLYDLQSITHLLYFYFIMVRWNVSLRIGVCVYVYFHTSGSFW